MITAFDPATGIGTQQGTFSAAGAISDSERTTAIRTLLAEEARMGMMVGVAVGWALAEELSRTEHEEEE